MGYSAATRIVEIWEQVAGAVGAERTHALLASCDPLTPARAFWRWPLGQCNERLLAAHQSLFGDDLTSVADCPACHRRIEARFQVDDLRQVCTNDGSTTGLQNASVATADHTESETRVVRVVTRQGEAEVRPPCLADLAAVEHLQDPDAIVTELVNRCVHYPSAAPCETGAKTGNADILFPLENAMARLDPWADLYTDMECAYCGQSWAAAFDVSLYLYERTAYWARRLLEEVHVLARRYHWSQEEILAMNPVRRQYYLNLDLA